MYEYRDPYIIDFTDVEYYYEMHFVIRDALDWPDYYGCNWDAFWDCLRDMSGRPLHVEIIGLDVIEKKFGDEAKEMIGLLKEFKHRYNNRFCDIVQIEIINGDTRIQIE